MRLFPGILVTLAFVTACAGAPPVTPAQETTHVDLCGDPAAPVTTVSIEYLGVGGFLIRHGDAALLTAPFYSNPGLPRVLLNGRIRPDPDRIPGRPALAAGARVHGILVGHAHYDHLMDVPVIVADWGLEHAAVYGSRTAANLLRAEATREPTRRPPPLREVNGCAGTWRRPGAWYAMPRDPDAHATQCDDPGVPAPARFRVMALHSEHAPHFLGLTAMQGHVEGVPRPPDTPWDWKEGQTFAWLVDVLAPDGGVLLRLYYQDAATSPPLGWPPRELLRERGVDVALLCAASFDQVSHHPEALVRDLAPQHVIAGHWEDFFRDPGRPPRVLPIFDRDAFVTRLRSALPPWPAASWAMPEPGHRTDVRVCDAGPGSATPGGERR